MYEKGEMFQFGMLCASDDTTAIPADVKRLSFLFSCVMSFFL